MAENEAKLFNNLMEHNSAYYGYELSKGEIKTVLQAFEQLKQYRAIGTVEDFKALKLKEDIFDRNIKNCKEIGMAIRLMAIYEFAERYKKENVAPKVFERIFRMVQLGESDFSEVAEYIDSLYCDLADEVAEQMKAGGIDG